MSVARFGQRGDTLIEVTIALAILSMTLMGATRLAIRAFQQGQTARERTAVALAAQQQLEHLRVFRDTHSWTEFTTGAADGSFDGVLSPHTGGNGCKTANCFKMVRVGSSYVPASGHDGVSSVDQSYLEIHAQSISGTIIKFTVDYGFPDINGGPAATGHIVTQLANLTAAIATPAPPTPPWINPVSPCVGDYKINLVPDAWISGKQMQEPLIEPMIVGFNHHYWTMAISGGGTDTLATVLAEVPPIKDFPQSLTLPAGNYQVMFMTYDDHVPYPPLGGTGTDGGFDGVPGQMTQEQLRMLLFLDGAGAPAITTAFTPDIPFNANIASTTYLTPLTVNGSQTLTNVRVQMKQRVAADINPNESNEGTVPLCAGFTKL